MLSDLGSDIGTVFTEEDLWRRPLGIQIYKWDDSWVSKFLLPWSSSLSS